MKAAITRNSTNRLICSLAHEDRDLLSPLLHKVDLPSGTVLEEAGEPIENVFFLESGFASVVAGNGPRATDAQMEVGLFGREGMSGLSVVMGDDRSINQVFMQAAGASLRISASDLRMAMQESATLRMSLLRYAQAFSVQVAQTALVNGRANLERRLARWLLMAQDRTDNASFPVTHRFLAHVLGVRRPGVTLALHYLEGYGLIKATRGSITIVDRKGLEARSDPSYGIPEVEYDRLIVANAPSDRSRARAVRAASEDEGLWAVPMDMATKPA